MTTETTGVPGSRPADSILAGLRVRAMFDGVVAVSGGQSDGWALRAAQALGCDLGYMGTRFIATREFGPGKGQFAMEALSGQASPAPRRYRDIWSAGHSASGVRDVPPVARVVDRLAAEYDQARAAAAARLGSSPTI